MRCLNHKTVHGVSAATHIWKCKLCRSRGVQMVSQTHSFGFSPLPTTQHFPTLPQPLPTLVRSQPAAMIAHWQAAFRAIAVFPLAYAHLFGYSFPGSFVWTVIWTSLVIEEFRVGTLFQIDVKNSIFGLHKHELDYSVFKSHARGSLYRVYS